MVQRTAAMGGRHVQAANRGEMILIRSAPGVARFFPRPRQSGVLWRALVAKKRVQMC